MRRQTAPGIGNPSLENDRLALSGTDDIQRPVSKKLALVIKVMLALRVEEHLVGLVPRKGAILVGIPQTVHHIQILGATAIILGIVDTLLTAEVTGSAFQPCRDMFQLARPPLIDRRRRARAPP